LTDVLHTARLKLMAALPANMQPNAERIASRFHLDPVAWFKGADPLPQLQTVARGLWSERFLKLRYRNSGEIYGRKLGPLGLVLKGGVWYLVAMSGKSIRTYRVAQMLDVEVTDEAFVRPTKFNLAEHWEQSSSAYEAGVYREEAEVRISPRGMGRLEALGPFIAAAATASAGKPDRDGWVRCSVPLENFDLGLQDMLRLGAEVEVLGPPAFRAQVAKTLHALAARYRD
jgi:predicted DNA-binding transcriptional regulator YafY